MNWLLDTNVVSELRKVGHSGRADPAFEAWAMSRIGREEYLSVVTLYELELGVRLVEGRDEDQGRRLRRWLSEQVETTFAGLILPLSSSIALRAAGLKSRHGGADADLFIAATALEHGLGVVTRNVRHFERLGVELLAPWSRR